MRKSIIFNSINPGLYGFANFQTAGTPGTPSGESPPTYPFGPREQADETRQAQQREANDAIADVNINDVFSREQAGTMTLMGKNFEANADRRNKIADLLFNLMGINTAKG